MNIARPIYLQKLIDRKQNGMIKVITGMRRCGKSFLLFSIFREHLKQSGVDDDHIIAVDLEDRRNKDFRNPDTLLDFIDKKMSGNDVYYILIDEVQMAAEFEDVLNSLLKRPNADVYVTGSNAKFLSKDVITEFRGRGDEVRIRPLSFAEFHSANPQADRTAALAEYMAYGGLPQTVSMKSPSQKEDYLKDLFLHTYLVDIKERYRIRNDEDLEELVRVVASAIGGLTNTTKLQNTFNSEKKSKISNATIKNYLDMLQDAFLVEKSTRYDIKGRKYIGTQSKYFFEDLGVRNAVINFRQSEESHLMENMIYNELRMRGYSVDVGQVMVNTKDANGVSKRKYFEVDFVCNSGFKRYYIQSALELSTKDKIEQELRSLQNINDSFPKMVFVGGIAPTYQNENGIIIMNVFDFLLGDSKLFV